MFQINNAKTLEQRNVEKYVSEIIETWLGCSLEKHPVLKIDTSEYINNYIEPDLYSEENMIVCKLYTYIGEIKYRQQHDIAQTIMNISWLEKRKKTKFRKIIVVIDEKVENCINENPFLSASINHFDFEVKRVDIPTEMKNKLAEEKPK